VVLAKAVHVDGKGEVLRGFEARERFFELEGIGAEVDEAFLLDQAGDDLVDLRMEERFATGNRDDGSAAFVGGGPTVLRREISAEYFGGELNFAAAGAGEVAAKQGLEHEDERVALDPAQALPQDVGGDGVGLGEGRHGSKFRVQSSKLELALGVH
jgi:hypothetical protein